MSNLFSIVLSEAEKSFLNSALQTTMLGLVLLYWSFSTMPVLACGSGNVDLEKGIFTCISGDISVGSIAAIVAGMTVASLLLGRAAELVQRSILAKIEAD